MTQRLREYWLACLDAAAANARLTDLDGIKRALAVLPPIKKTRRSREIEAEGNYSKSQIVLILDAQKHRCAYARPGAKPAWCKGRITLRTCHKDHIQALANKGSNWASNIQLTCGPCNVRKQAKDPIIFAQQIGLLL